MNKAEVTIRLMRADDFDAVLGIDEEVLKISRRQYYEMKFEKLFRSKDYLPTSLVAEDAEGAVLGFVMGELFIGEYGIFQEEARLDTIGVLPGLRHRGIGERLISEFMAHMKSLGVQKIRTLVNLTDSQLIGFFSANKFNPSNTISLERSL
jgi:ribosomal protein S18 acetylase RimI-like enzyme